MTISISMVMLSEAPTLYADAICQNLSTNWGDLPAASDVTFDQGILSFILNDIEVYVAPMPAPIPWSDLEGPCNTSMLWKNALEEVKSHTHHLLITLRSELGPVEQAAMLTRISAAVMSETPSVLGIYWCNATMVIPKKIFIDFTIEILPDGPPIPIWVDIRVCRDSDSTSSGFTTGMAALGQMEFETSKSPETPTNLYERLGDLILYVLENGPVLNDGDTVGNSTAEKIRVVYTDSTFGIEGKVIKLVYETNDPRKPWWKFWGN
jgi:hypothetical protein